MIDLFKEFKFHTLGFIACLLGAPFFAWWFPGGNHSSKDLNIVACCCVATAAAILSHAFFKQGVHADAASTADTHK